MSGPYSVAGDRLMSATGVCIATSPDHHWLETWRDHLNAASASGRDAERKRVVEWLRGKERPRSGDDSSFGQVRADYAGWLADELEAQP